MNMVLLVDRFFFFSFQCFEYMMPLSVLACKVSAEKSADNLMKALLRVTNCLLLPLSRFSLYL